MATTPTPVTPTPKPQPAPKPAKVKAPRKPRAVDPAIAAIRKEAWEKVLAHRKAQASAKRLARIVRLCEKLTDADKKELIAVLS